MPILDMHPHTLYRELRRPGHDDENGDYTPGPATWQRVEQCDAVPSGKEETAQYDDGTTGRYSYTVYLSALCPTLKPGDRVAIRFFSGREMREFTVLGFQRYQHQSKLWV